MRVTARTTMAQYKKGTADIGRIGKDHGVRAVLEGSVRQDGEHVVVTTQLIDTRNGYHLWADRYERNKADLPGAQREVAGIVVSRLQKLVQGKMPWRSEELAADPKTLELYHRAMDLLRIPVIKNGPSRQTAGKCARSGSSVPGGYGPQATICAGLGRTRGGRGVGI